MSNYNWYEVREKGRNIFGFRSLKSVYNSTHASHIALWMVHKDWSSYVIFKNGEEILFHPMFVVNPNQLTINKIDEFQSYLEEWQNNPEYENPTGL